MRKKDRKTNKERKKIMRKRTKEIKMNKGTEEKKDIYVHIWGRELYDLWSILYNYLYFEAY